MGRKKSDQLPANIVVRNAIMHFVRAAIPAGKPVKLPSAREFAEKLGFSQRTIITEMKRLVEAGSITSKNGVGYFTNMHNQLEYESFQYPIGLFYERSMAYFLYDYNQWSLLTRPGLAITAHKTGKIQPVPATSRNPELFYKELEAMELSAAVFVFPLENWFEPIRKFRNAGHPVVLLLPPFNPLPSDPNAVAEADTGDLPTVSVDRTACGEDLARLAMKRIKDSSRPVFWCHYHDERNIAISEGFFKTFTRKNPVRIFNSSGEIIAAIREGFPKNEIPAMVFTHTSWTEDIIRIFVDAGIDPYENTLFIGDICRTRLIPGYRGISFGYPHDELAEAVNTLIVRQKIHKKAENICLKMIVKEDFQNTEPSAVKSRKKKE